MSRGILDGRFELVAPIGSGGMGTIWRGIDLETQSAVAIKIMLLSSPAVAARFAREREVLAGVRHPAIVRYVGGGSAGAGRGYLVMEWIDGVDLDSRLREGPLGVAETCQIAERIAGALAELHRVAVVHRDLKPANVMLAGGEPSLSKLVDFGLARDTEAHATVTSPGGILGTPHYMSPERIQSERIGPEADVFALGCVLYECLSGQKAFFADTLPATLMKIVLERPAPFSTLGIEVPGALEALIFGMLEKDPSSRLRDGAHVLRELSSLDAAPATLRIAPRHITGGERRVISVILLSAPALATERERLIQLAAAAGARAHCLLDGTTLCSLEGGGSARERALAALRLARELSRELAGCRVVLATGAAQVWDRLPVGSVIDRAAKMMHDAEAGRVRIDATTAALTQGESSALVDAARLEPGRESPELQSALRLPFVGRERELERLCDQVTSAWQERKPRMLVVSGPLGIGKSRLANEAVARLRCGPGGARLWRAEGDSTLARVALGLLGALIRDALPIRGPEPLAEQRRMLSERASSPRVAEFLGELIGARFDARERPELAAAREDPILMGDQIRRAAHEFVEREARENLLIVLDDAEWGDGQSFQALMPLLAETIPLAVLVVGRPEVESLLPSSAPFELLRVGPLSDADAERLVIAALGSEPPRDRLSALLQHAAGVPLHLEELLTGELREDAHSPPETLIAAMQVRLERLSQQARRALRAASIFGESFWTDGVARLLGEPSNAVEMLLDDMVAEDLVLASRFSRFAATRQYAFRHPLLCQAAYGLLTPEDARLGHRLAGEWLEHAGEREPFRIAEHFARSESPARAVRHYARASEDALGRNDFAAVIARAERAVAAGASGDALGWLRRLQAEAHHWAGEAERVMPVGREALGLLEVGSAPWFSAARFVAASATRAQDVASVREMAELFLKSARDANAEARAMGAARVAGNLLMLGEPDLGKTLLAEAEAFVARQTLPFPALSAVIHDARARLAAHERNMERHERERLEALRAFHSTGNRRAECIARVNVGYARLEMGLYAEARTELDLAREEADELGLKAAVATSDQLLGLALERLGLLAEARVKCRGAIEACSALGDRRIEATARLYLSAIACAEGELTEALREATRGLELLADNPTLAPFARAALAHVLLALGQNADALELSREAYAAVDVGLEEGEPLVRLVHARALLATGHVAEARDVAEKAVALVQERAKSFTDPLRRAAFIAIPEHRALERLCS